MRRNRGSGAVRRPLSNDRPLRIPVASTHSWAQSHSGTQGLYSSVAGEPLRARKPLGVMKEPSDRRRRAVHQSSKRVHDGEPTSVEGSHSANTSCSVLNVAVSVFAETAPSFFASRILSTARI